MLPAANHFLVKRERRPTALVLPQPRDGPKMDSFLIRGGTRLKGKIEIRGSKNSALPIIAATLMANGKTTLKGVPRLSDIDSMTKLIGELGCHVYRHEPPAGVGDMPALNGPLDIEVTDEKNCEARYDIVKTMRASICV